MLENLKENAEFEINETPQFDTIGVSLDCSRNGVIKVSKVKEIIEILAVMGINLLALYTENTYEIQGEPYFGYMRGRYSHKELKELGLKKFSLHTGIIVIMMKTPIEI